MDRPMVVLNGSKNEQRVVSEALDLADDADAFVEFLATFTSEELATDRETLESIAEIEGGDFRSDPAASLAQQAINKGMETTDASVDYNLSTRVDDESRRADEILAAIEDHGCDHVFMGGKRRSPTGKIIFGDVVQTVLLNADVPVTTILEDDT